MKKLIPILLLGLLLLAACARDDVPIGGSEPAPPTAPMETPEPNPLPTPEPEPVDDGLVSSLTTGIFVYGLPDWEGDFSPNRRITLERFIQHLTEAGSTFSIQSEQPLVFSNGHLEVWLDESSEAMHWIMVESVRLVPADSWWLDTQRGTMRWPLATTLWDAMAITNLYTDANAAAGMVAEAFVDLRQTRFREHRLASERREKLSPSVIDANDPPFRWMNVDMSVSPAVISVIPVALGEFNSALASVNANFQSLGSGLAWSNGYLNVEVRPDTHGAKIVIFDTPERAIEIMDDTGGFAAGGDELSGGLALMLWWVLGVCDTFTTMDSVFAEQAVNDTFYVALGTLRITPGWSR